MEAKEYQMRKIESNCEKIVKICSVYAEMEDITEFVLDLQVYSENEYTGKTESRIWLTCPKNRLGISLSLYSIKLCNSDEILSDEDAMDVFGAYQKFYALNKDKFQVKTHFGEKTVKFSFEISMR